jgi:hypothetical protein
MGPYSASERREVFEADHPEVAILGPCEIEIPGRWVAYWRETPDALPGDSRIIACAPTLTALMDVLEPAFASG